MFMGINMGMGFKTDTLQITPDLLSLAAEIDEFKGAWRTLGTLAPNRLSALRQIATIESIGSSARIEDSKLSDADAVALTGANRNTVKKHLIALVDANHLAQHGTGKGTWYGPSETHKSGRASDCLQNHGNTKDHATGISLQTARIRGWVTF